MKKSWISSLCVLFIAIAVHVEAGNGMEVDEFHLISHTGLLYAPLPPAPAPPPGHFWKGVAVGGSAGTCWFHGDLANYHSIPRPNERDAFQFGWSAYAQKDVYKGLIVKVQFEHGDLRGGRSPGKQSPVVNFHTTFSQIGVHAQYDVFKQLFQKDSRKKRYSIDLEAGLGLTLWRSLSVWTGQDERVRGFVGYTVTDNNPPTQRYTAKAKAAPAMALTIPVGVSGSYMLNYKTDVVLSYTLNNLFTDRLDTWSRDWTAKDKYSFFSIGLRYNFMRDPQDMPAKREKKHREKHKKDKSSQDDKNNKDQSSVSPAYQGNFSSQTDPNAKPHKISLPFPIRARKSKNFSKNVEGDMKKMQLQIYEMQLRMLEMQAKEGNTSN